MGRASSTSRAATKQRMPNGHTRLKQALVLRDALAEELGIALESAMAALRGVEDNIGIGLALTDGRYRDALASLSTGNCDHLKALDEQVGRVCARVALRPRYAQYLALLLFAHWMHVVQEDRQAFLARLNTRIEMQPREGVTPFEDADLQLVAFWMATAAGKTHVLHACLALLENFRRWNRIIVITPSEALTLQHAEKLKKLATWGGCLCLSYGWRCNNGRTLGPGYGDRAGYQQAVQEQTGLWRHPVRTYVRGRREPRFCRRRPQGTKKRRKRLERDSACTGRHWRTLAGGAWPAD